MNTVQKNNNITRRQVQELLENNDEESLKEKYDIQLAIYKKALEKALDRKVDKVYIYSTWLARVITINFEL